MGQTESTLPYAMNMQTMESYAYTPVSIDHRSSAKPMRSLIIDQPGTLHKTAYYAVWSMEYTEGIGPGSRVGQCSVFDEAKQRIIVAYGCDFTGQYRNDVWALDIATLQWSLIRKSALSPRQYPSSVLVGRKMLVFGGAMKHEFYSDLHTIDIDTGDVQYLQCSGVPPEPRTSPCLFSANGSLFLWGGYNGSTLSGIFHFKYATLEWSKFEQTHTGRAAAAFCEHKGRYFVYGSSKGHGLLEFHPNDGSFETLDCTGTEPSHQLNRASLLSVDDYLFLIGGESDSQFMHVFALDVERRWWFAFHVRPDMKSLNLSDGHVNSNGLFMMPREYSAAVHFDSQTKSVFSVLGSRQMDPVPLFKIGIGEALGSLHLRSDMLTVFKKGFY